MFGQKPYNPQFTVQACETSQYRQLKEAIRKDTVAALKKFRPFSIVQCILGLLTAAFGAAAIVVSFSNRGFPVFNVTPLLAGILELGTGLWLFFTTKKAVRDDERQKFNRKMQIHCFLSLLVVAVAAVALIIAFIAFSVCLKLEEEYFYYIDGGIRYARDVEQYCHPSRDAKVALSFFTGVTSLLVFMWNCYGFCFYCTYGMMFGMGWQGKI